MNVNKPVLTWIVFFLIVANLSALQSHLDHNHILCRQCGNELAESDEIFLNVSSPHAESVRNTTVLGHPHILVQILRNPGNVVFDIVTLKTAGCLGVKEWYSEHTWFPGYSWKVCLCPRCHTHIGWMFEPTESATNKQVRVSSKGFYGLILSKLLSEDFADSLLISSSKSLKY